MKPNIHPKWNNECQVTCVCGNKFTTGSTQDEIQVEICAKCHPFFTGEMKFVDTQGRVDKFMKKREASAAKKAALEEAAAKKRGTKGQDSTNEPQKTYRQILAQSQSDLKKKSDSKPTAKTEAQAAAKTDQS